MSIFLSPIFLSIPIIAFLSVIFMNLARRNEVLINLYILQSLAVFLGLLKMAFQHAEISLILVAALTIVVKGVAAPMFFYHLVKKQKVQSSATAYLSTPLTLLVLMGLTVFAYSKQFDSVAFLAGNGLGAYLPLVFSSILISLVLIINRKGAFSQIIGILSLENSIVLLASFIGLQYPISLELGILFDIAVWVVVATVFIALLHKHFGSLNVTDMKRLKEE
ncbi:MAG: hypothetical protein HYV77_03865 [Candidatus Wildermuthbacteria bacterium]|nr:hypothetical protein [Candidatus Wildermuthbacteria bacterium]